MWLWTLLATRHALSRYLCSYAHMNVHFECDTEKSFHRQFFAREWPLDLTSGSFCIFSEALCT